MQTYYVGVMEWLIFDQIKLITYDLMNTDSKILKSTFRIYFGHHSWVVKLITKLIVSMAKFLNLVTTDILGQIIACTADVSSVSFPGVAIKNISRHQQISPGGKITPGWETMVYGKKCSKSKQGPGSTRPFSLHRPYPLVLENFFLLPVFTLSFSDLSPAGREFKGAISLPRLVDPLDVRIWRYCCRQSLPFTSIFKNSSLGPATFQTEPAAVFTGATTNSWVLLRAMRKVAWICISLLSPLLDGQLAARFHVLR